MASAAEKRKAKRRAAREARIAAGLPDGRGGHNKKHGVERHPSGRINQAMQKIANENRETATELRMRVFGVSRADALSAKAATVFGRLCLHGEINEDQYEAGVEFAKRRKAYLAAIQSPRGTRSGSDIGYIHETLEAEPNDASRDNVFDLDVDGTSEAYVERCSSARRRYSELRRAVMDEDSLGIMALEIFIDDDRMSERLLGSLRVACNAISHVINPPKNKGC